MSRKINQELRLRIREEQRGQSRAWFRTDMYRMEVICKNLDSHALAFKDIVNSAIPNIERVINRRRINGNSPLTLAILNGFYYNMITLLEAGAFPEGIEADNMPMKTTALVTDQKIATPMRLALLYYGAPANAGSIISPGFLAIDKLRMNFFLTSTELNVATSEQRKQCMEWLQADLPRVLASIVVDYIVDTSPDFYELYGLYESRFLQTVTGRENRSNSTSRSLL